MADVKKINGYNIKDASARNDISSLDTRVDNLESAINDPDTGINAQISTLSSDIYHKSDFIVLTGTITIDSNHEGDDTVSYPTGFSKDNTYIISGKHNLNNANYDNAIPMIYTDINDGSVTGTINTVLGENGITVYCEGAVFSENDTVSYELLIMKIDEEVEEL